MTLPVATFGTDESTFEIALPAVKFSHQNIRRPHFIPDNIRQRTSCDVVLSHVMEIRNDFVEDFINYCKFIPLPYLSGHSCSIAKIMPAVFAAHRWTLQDDPDLGPPTPASSSFDVRTAILEE